MTNHHRHTHPKRKYIPLLIVSGLRAPTLESYAHQPIIHNTID